MECYDFLVNTNDVLVKEEVKGGGLIVRVTSKEEPLVEMLSSSLVMFTKCLGMLMKGYKMKILTLLRKLETRKKAKGKKVGKRRKIFFKILKIIKKVGVHNKLFRNNKKWKRSWQRRLGYSTNL